jgi:hypothetical protein
MMEDYLITISVSALPSVDVEDIAHYVTEYLSGYSEREDLIIRPAKVVEIPD